MMFGTRTVLACLIASGLSIHSLAQDEASASKNRFLFTGYVWDAETALYYAKARYYDPKLGRFVTQDSYLGKLTDPPSLHRFLYAHDNPTRFIDPGGQSDADANQLAAAMHQRMGFLASDHRPADQRGYWYNFSRELYADLPPRLIPMSQLEGLANQDAGQFARGTAEIVIAAALPTAVKKGAQALVARFPVLGKSVTEVVGEGLGKLKPRPTAPPIETISVADTLRSERPFMPDGDGRMVPFDKPRSELPHPDLPEFAGKKATGILEIDGDETVLTSGYQGPSASLPKGTPGMNNRIRSHVEAHAAATMRTEGATEATLYTNRTPCAGVTGCDAMLPRMLPKGAKLTVIGPGGATKVYTGIPDPPKASTP